MMTKTGDISSATPPETLPAKRPEHPEPPATKEAADQLEDHVVVRASEVVKSQAVKTATR